MKRASFIFGGIAGAIGLLLIGLGQRLQPKPPVCEYDTKRDVLTMDGVEYKGEALGRAVHLVPAGRKFGPDRRYIRPGGAILVFLEKVEG